MRKLPLADRLRVRTPCDVGWENMDERGRDRHCTRCDLTVHDVASMTRVEVETVLEARERSERVCLHLHVRRSDGAVLVADGHVERPRRSPPSRVVAAAMATATVMTACASSTSPPEAPLAVIAVGTATAPAIETAPPPPPPVEAPPIDPTALPTPDAPAKKTTTTTVAKAIAPAHPPAKKPPAKKHYVIIDGDAGW